MSRESALGDTPFRVPKTSQVRQHLAHALREVEVLRRLLRIAEYVERRQPVVEEAAADREVRK